MQAGVDRFEILFDARLVEESVLLAENRESGKRRQRFRLERDRLYTRGDPDERERLFERFHRDWFERMELAGPLVERLRELPDLPAGARRCVVMPAARSTDEGADLRSEQPLTGPTDRPTRPTRPTLILQLRPATLVDSPALARLLDHELLHVADMLDPSFGYTGELPPGSPAWRRRATERYRVLWDCTIDGRLQRQGKLAEGIEESRRRDFVAAFPELGARAATEFDRWFGGKRSTHAAMLELACGDGAGSARGICPLCEFSASDLLDACAVRDELRHAIVRDFPAWRPVDGLCRQCLDLYDAADAVAQGAHR